MNISPIAYAHNGFSDKFGIPRQSREESHIETRIVFEKAYRHPDAIRGIEGYSHLWLIWGFSRVSNACKSGVESKLTVRPPRLGGNTRVGVFATRSPFRPNGLGLSSVRLLRVEQGELIVSGADLLDGTPIYDIKPYLSFSDSHPEAVNGFAEDTKDYRLSVVWDKDPSSVLSAKERQAIEEILSQDPRPAYQHDERTYKLDYAGHHIAFCVVEGCVKITFLD